MKTIDLAALLAALRQEPKPTLVEALGLKAFREGHLPGAVHLPRSRVLATAHTLLPDPEQWIIVYCRDPACHSALEVATALVELGYQRVSHFEEGKEAWVRAGHPLER